jgi:hypothetical protein
MISALMKIPPTSPSSPPRERHQIRGHADLTPRVNKICGMIADAIISGANPIPGAIRFADRRGGAACGRGLGHGPRAGTFARAGQSRFLIKGQKTKSPQPTSMATGSKPFAMMAICR